MLPTHMADVVICVDTPETRYVPTTTNRHRYFANFLTKKCFSVASAPEPERQAAEFFFSLFTFDTGAHRCVL